MNLRKNGMSNSSPRNQFHVSVVLWLLRFLFFTSKAKDAKKRPLLFYSSVLETDKKRAFSKKAKRVFKMS